MTTDQFRFTGNPYGHGFPQDFPPKLHPAQAPGFPSARNGTKPKTSAEAKAAAKDESSKKAQPLLLLK